MSVQAGRTWRWWWWWWPRTVRTQTSTSVIACCRPVIHKPGENFISTTTTTTISANISRHRFYHTTPWRFNGSFGATPLALSVFPAPCANGAVQLENSNSLENLQKDLAALSSVAAAAAAPSPPLIGNEEGERAGGEIVDKMARI